MPDNRAAQLGPELVSWWPDWRGECVAIVASGPSVKNQDLSPLRDRIHVVAVNESFRLVPWAEVVYGCDFAWWALHKGLPKFAGLRLSHDRRACREFPGIQKVEIENVSSNDVLVERPSFVGAGGNSGFQALNLAIQFGATGIMLIGVDARLDSGCHWHGRHPVPLNNPAESNVRRWREAFDGAAPAIAALGVDVVNCSPVSALCGYPKMTIEQALARWSL